MESHPVLNITWGKAFDEVYGHHASLFIPYDSMSLFPPELVRVGVTIRTNEIVKRKVASHSDSSVFCYLKCDVVDGGLSVPLNSSEILDGLCLEYWTTFKGGVRGNRKQFPVSISYQIQNEPMVTIPFKHKDSGTPFLLSESKFVGMHNGDKIDVAINLK